MELLLLIIVVVFIATLFRVRNIDRRLDRLMGLESDVALLSQRLSRLEKAAAGASRRRGARAPTPVPEAAVESLKTAPATPPAPIAVAQPAAVAAPPSAPVYSFTPAVKRLEEAGEAPQVEVPETAPVPSPAAARKPPLRPRPEVARAAAEASPEAPAKPAPPPTGRRSSLEELLASQLFPKIGVAIVVLGVAFFLGYALKQLGPPWRVAIGYLGGAAMLAGGLRAEGRDRFRTFGRALVAGAWAIFYFVTFAMHFLPAAQILHSRPLGILALLVAAAAAVAFSLRYRSEWTTLASFLLIFLALLLAALELDARFNLAATAVVAVALAALRAGPLPALLLLKN